jgi:exopolysaccharide production protein ExoZ
MFARILQFGSAGVEFFFVLSCFIISYAHRADIGRPAALPSFVWRRAIRIYPAYWMVFLGVAALVFSVPAFKEGLPQGGIVWIKSLLLVPQDPIVVGGTGAPLIIVAWSLRYELVFYVAFGLFIISLLVGLAVSGPPQSGGLRVPARQTSPLFLSA